MLRDGQGLRPAEHSYNDGLNEQQQSWRRNAGKGESPFSVKREKNEIERQEQADRGERGAAGAAAYDMG